MKSVNEAARERGREGGMGEGEAKIKTRADQSVGVGENLHNPRML